MLMMLAWGCTHAARVDATQPNVDSASVTTADPAGVGGRRSTNIAFTAANGAGNYALKSNALWPPSFSGLVQMSPASNAQIALLGAQVATQVTALRNVDWLGREAWFVDAPGEGGAAGLGRIQVGRILGLPSTDGGTVVGDVLYRRTASPSRLLVVLDRKAPLHLFNDFNFDGTSPTSTGERSLTHVDESTTPLTCENGGECFFTTRNPISSNTLRSIHDSIPNYSATNNVSGATERGGDNDACPTALKRKIFDVVSRTNPELIHKWRTDPDWYQTASEEEMAALGDAMRAAGIPTDGPQSECLFEVAEEDHAKNVRFDCNAGVDIAPIFRVKPRLEGHIALLRGEAWVTSRGQFDVGIRASAAGNAQCEADFVPLMEKALGRRLSFRVPLVTLYGIDVLVFEGGPVARGVVRAQLDLGKWQATYVRHYAWNVRGGVTRTPDASVSPPIGSNNGLTHGAFFNAAPALPDDFDGDHDGITNDVVREGQLEATVSLRMELGYKLGLFAGVSLEKRILGIRINLLRAGVTGTASLLAFNDATFVLGDPDPNETNCMASLRVEAGIDLALGLSAEISALGIEILKGSWERRWPLVPRALLLERSWQTDRCNNVITGGECAPPVCNANRGDYCNAAFLTSDCGGPGTQCTPQCVAGQTDAHLSCDDDNQNVVQNMQSCDVDRCVWLPPETTLVSSCSASCCWQGACVLPQDGVMCAI